jgi:hypothetical protein
MTSYLIEGPDRNPPQELTAEPADTQEPTVELVHHYGKDSDGDPYERTELRYRGAPPVGVLVETIRTVLTTHRHWGPPVDRTGEYWPADTGPPPTDPEATQHLRVVGP